MVPSCGSSRSTLFVLVKAKISPVAGRWSITDTVSPAISPVTGARATIVPGELESNRTISGEAPAVTPTIASAAWLVAGITTRQSSASGTTFFARASALTTIARS